MTSRNGATLAIGDLAEHLDLISHSLRVADLAARLAARHPHSDMVAIDQVRIAGMLHDIGKTCIDARILRKPGSLTVAEYQCIQEHPAIGAQMVAAMHLPVLVVSAVRHHHEWWDGSGYPDRLRGTAIPLTARILSIADTWDALCSPRPYRPARTPDQAWAIVVANAGVMFDPDLIDSLAAIVHGPPPAVIQPSMEHQHAPIHS